VDSADRESIEGDLQREFEVLCRNLYAFYPLLIKFVDMHRAYWLKNPDEHSETLYYHIAEVFNIWLRSKMFKKEELNFVSANEIDNMLLIMPQGAGKNAPAAASDSQPIELGGKKKRGKKKKRFTSLIVACLKRLMQIGVNFFEGKEQEMIQIAKQKFVDIKTGNFAELKLSAGKIKMLKNAALLAESGADAGDDNIELSKDMEDIVEDFINKYMKTFESIDNVNAAAAAKSGGAAEGSAGAEAGVVCAQEEPQIVFNEAMDKDTYQKTKWQRMLYRKISSKKRIGCGSELPIIQRIMEISKVRFFFFFFF
jgi:hypothetical protein